MHKFDSVEMFFRLQDRWDRIFPWALGLTAFILAPIFASWIEAR